MIDLIPIYCRSCGVRVGLSTGKPMHTVYCNEICAEDPMFSENEERDDLIEFLARAEGWDPTKVAVNFDLSRQRADQIIKRRMT